MNEPLLEDGQVWLRAQYGFGPEDHGYIGFTGESDRDAVLSKIRDRDLILIYGAANPETLGTQRTQALGFFEVEAKACIDEERMSADAISIRRSGKHADQWRFGIVVRRAWRINNRVHIKTIATTAYEKKYRFDRTRRAILLSSEEARRALSHPVRQVNVYGETPTFGVELQSGGMGELLKPSKGIPPSDGERTSTYEDGENMLYLMMLSGPCEVLMGKFGPHVGKTLVKVGRSNDPKRRLSEVNGGFPERSIYRWELKRQQSFSSVKDAHDQEDKLKKLFDDRFTSEGNEFFSGDWEKLESAFIGFCVSALPKILGAARKAGS